LCKLANGAQTITQHIVAAADRAPDNLLRSAPTVERRRVDSVDAGVESRVDRAHRIVLVLRTPVHPPRAGKRTDRRRAYPDRRDREIALAESSKLHAALQRTPELVYAAALARYLKACANVSRHDPVGRGGNAAPPERQRDGSHRAAEHCGRMLDSRREDITAAH
jgi:hypothetical protein